MPQESAPGGESPPGDEPTTVSRSGGSTVLLAESGSGTGLAGAGEPEELRPPESWPGAAGAKSVAPDVPAWPGKRRSHDPGGSWPGAISGAPPAPAPPPPLDAAAIAELMTRPPSTPVAGAARGLWALSTLLWWLGPVLAVCAWIVVDPAHRAAQTLAFLAVVVVGAGHVVVGPLLRYRRHRYEAIRGSLYTQSGILRDLRRVAAAGPTSRVELTHGPLERAFGLGTVTVTDADGGQARVRGLDRSARRGLMQDLGQKRP